MRPEARRRLVRSLVEQGSYASQEQIRVALAGAGHEVTQATVSRDLDAVGAVRMKNGSGTVYRIGTSTDMSGEYAALVEAFDEFVMSFATSGTSIVLKVPPGAAQFVASRIDAAAIPGVLGSIAGDDTILVIADEDFGATTVLERLQGVELI